MRLPRVLGALGLALATALVVPALPVTPAPSASAAACAGSGGVTVVVDYNQLGGDMLLGCVANGGGRVARGVFTDAGASQSDVQRTPGFVCRVNGKPTQAQDPCVNTPPATAYWSLWWTDGKGGPWTYSNLGVNSLKVPDGGYLAWSWQGQSAKSPPDFTPVARASAPSGGTGSGDGGSGGGSNGGSGGSTGGSGGSGGSGSGSPGDGPSSDAPSASPSDDPSASDGASDDPTAGSGAARGKGGKQARGEKAGENGQGKDGKSKNGKGENDKGKRGDGAGDGAREGGGESVDSPLTDENGDTEQVSSASDEDPAGLPVWVPVAVLVVLAAGGVGSVVWRRRTNGGA